MANRGGGRFPNYGRGQGPGDGRGNNRWDGGSNGGRGNFFQGGPSGAAGQDDLAGGNHNNNVFADGVFRAGRANPVGGRGGYNNGRERFNNGAGFYRGNGRHFNNQEKEGPEKMAGEIQAGTSPQSIVQAASSPGPLMSGSPNGGSPLKSVSNGPSSHVIYNESGVAKKPTLEETIAFGGIKETTTLGIRSSGRLRAEPNADATQMERAMLIAQRRDELHTSGYSTGYALDSTMGILTPSGSAGPHGYWMQPDAYGCT